MFGLIASAAILSDRVRLLLFIYLTVMPISLIFDGLIVAGRSGCTVSMSSVFSASGLFKSYSNCSKHLFRYSSISMTGLPSLFLNGHSD